MQVGQSTTINPSSSINRLQPGTTAPAVPGALLWGQCPVLGSPLFPTSTDPAGFVTAPGSCGSAAAPELPCHPGLVMTAVLNDSIANPGLTPLSDNLGSQPQGAPAASEVPERKKRRELQTQEALRSTPASDSSLGDKEWKTGHCAVVASLPAIEWKGEQQN